MATKDDIVIGVRIELLQAQQQLKKIKSSVNKMVNPGVPSFTKLANAQEAVRMAQEKLANSMGSGQRKFAGWAMSIMFFGMALQRMFGTVWKDSTKTFNDVSHSVEGTVTQFDMLNGSMTYLGFVAGQALEPLAAFLIPIIDKISDWILNNDELFRSIVSIGFIAGTTFAVGGAAVLAINGFIDLFSKLGFVTLDAKGAISSWELGILANPTFLAVLAALAVLAGVSWVAFKKAPEALASLDKVLGTLWTSVQNLGDSLLDLVESILGVDVAWQDVAWFMAWSLKIITLYVNLWVQQTTRIVNALTAVVYAAKAVGNAAYEMWQALNARKAPNWGATTTALSKLLTATTALKNGLLETIETQQVLTDTFKQGPEGMKREYLANLQAESSSLFTPQGLLYSQAPNSSTETRNNVTTYVNNYITLDKSMSEKSMLDVLSGFKSTSSSWGK